jgi:hypothetical protein
MKKRDGGGTRLQPLRTFRLRYFESVVELKLITPTATHP